jgi:hypothetical protein
MATLVRDPEEGQVFGDPSASCLLLMGWHGSHAPGYPFPKEGPGIASFDVANGSGPWAACGGAIRVLLPKGAVRFFVVEKYTAGESGLQAKKFALSTNV